MRTFHIGGAAQRGAEQSSIEAAFSAKVSLTNRNVVKNSSGVLIVMSRNMEATLLDEEGRESETSIPMAQDYLQMMELRSNRATLAEWDPYTIPIITEKKGTANYVDLVDGVSMREVMDEGTGIASRVVFDWKQQPKGSELRPRITLRDDKGEVIELENGLEARYFMSVDAILSWRMAPKSKLVTF